MFIFSDGTADFAQMYLQGWWGLLTAKYVFLASSTISPLIFSFPIHSRTLKNINIPTCVLS
jgi:hypothetical protein